MWLFAIKNRPKSLVLMLLTLDPWFVLWQNPAVQYSIKLDSLHRTNDLPVQVLGIFKDKDGWIVIVVTSLLIQSWSKLNADTFGWLNPRFLIARWFWCSLGPRCGLRRWSAAVAARPKTGGTWMWRWWGGSDKVVPQFVGLVGLFHHRN